MRKTWYLLLVDGSLYLLLFTLVSFCTVLPALHVFANPVMPLFLVWGLLILGYHLLIRRKNLFRDHLLLGIFLLSYLVTMLLHRENFLENLKTLLWTACFFYVFLEAFPRNRWEENRRLFVHWTNLLLILTFVAGLLSCLMYLTQYLHYIDVPFNAHQPQGLWGNRLVGVYREANFGAMFGMVSMGLSVYHLCTVKDRRAFHIVNLVVQFFFVIWTLSRGALVTMCAVLPLVIFLSAHHQGLSVWRSAACAVLSAVLYLACFWGIPQITGYIPPYLNAKIEQYVIINDSHRSPDFTDEVRDEHNKVEPGRDYDKGFSDVIQGENDADDEDFLKDISTGRLAVWKDAVLTWVHYPLFGVGARNISHYAKLIRPNGMLARSYSMHNAFLRVLLSCGAVGFLLLMTWGIVVLLRHLGCLWLRQAPQGLTLGGYTALFGVVLTILAACCFLDGLFLYTSAESVIFWVLIGYLYSLLPQRENQSKTRQGKFHWI